MVFYTYYPYPPKKEPPYDEINPIIPNDKFDVGEARKKDGGLSTAPPMCTSGAWSATKSSGLKWSTSVVLVCAMSQLVLRQVW